jgi:hypothetical protein
MKTSEMWTVTVRSRLGEHLSYRVAAPDELLAIAAARGRARSHDSYGLWRWPLVSAHQDDWQRQDALEGRR